MAFLGQTFDTAQLPVDDSSYDPLPVGWYTARIERSEVKTTRAGNGQYIAITYDITGPTHSGRKVFDNLNIQNPNPTAQEIGMKSFGGILRAIGLPSCQDSDQLVGGQLSVKLGIELSEQYGDKNSVKGTKAIDRSTAPQFAPQAAPQPYAAPAPAPALAPPWANQAAGHQAPPSGQPMGVSGPGADPFIDDIPF